MSSYPPPGPASGSRIDEVLDRIEAELHAAVAFVNDAIVPQVRQESIAAMRTLADKLHNLADRFERNAAQSTGQPGTYK